MPTTSQILGLDPRQRNAAIFTVAGEAGPGRDIHGVSQTILARLKKTNGNIANLVKAPQQFVANDPYSINQVTDESFGRKIYGSKYDQIAKIFDDPNQMVSALQQGQGATSFRGQALLKNKQKEDIMFDPKGNFYFDRNPDIAKSLSERLRKGAGTVPNKVSEVPQNPQQPTGGNTYIVYSGDNDPMDFLNRYVTNKNLNKDSTQLRSSFDPTSLLAKAFFSTPNYLGDDG